MHTEQMIAPGSAEYQMLLWMLFIAFLVFGTGVILDILIWCWQWWKGEDDEQEEPEEDGLIFLDDVDDPDCGNGDDNAVDNEGFDGGSGNAGICRNNAGTDN